MKEAEISSEFEELWIAIVVQNREPVSGGIILLADEGKTSKNYSSYNRNPYFVFESDYGPRKGWKYKYPDKIDRLFQLVPAMKTSHPDKIKYLFDFLPYWLEEYTVVEDTYFEINPEYVIEQWSYAGLLIKIGSKYHRWTHLLPKQFREIKELIRPTAYSYEKFKARRNEDIAIN